MDIGVSETSSSANLDILLGNGDGTFTVTVTNLSVGSNLSGMFIGDVNGDGLTDLIVSSYGSNRVTVLLGSLIPTTTALTTTVTSPVLSGTPVPLTATVTIPEPGFYPTPSLTGSVVFLDGSAVLSTVPVASLSASYTIPSLAPGTHALTAQYSGDANYQPSTSAPIAIEATGGRGAVIVTVGPPQTTAVGAAFPVALQAEVTDGAGDPLAGQTVTFTPAPAANGASATLSAASAVSNAAGIVSVTATANTLPGVHSVIATVAGLTGGASFALTNLPGAPASITAAAGATPQSGVVNTALAFPLKVIVKDSFGNPLPGLTVTYTAPASGPSVLLSSSTATTIADGSAQVTGTRNTVAGAFTVSATVAGVTTPLTFSLSNTPDVPAAFTVVAGSPQTTKISTAFPVAIQVQAKDKYGNATPALAVAITTPSLGASASFSPESGSTDATGTFATTATANNKAGAYSVTFSVDAVLITPAGIAILPITATVSLTNSAGAAAAVVASPGGTPQSAQISTAFAQSLQVVVTDAGGNPVPGVTVSFSAPTTGASASLSPASAATNAAGQATVTATANTTAGSYFVTATAGSFSLEFILTNSPGAPDNLTALPGSTPQSATVGTLFANPLTVVVRDSLGNPVPGVTVIFTAPTAGPTTYTDNAVSDALGHAMISVAANDLAGSYIVTATAAPSDVNAAPLNFNLTNVAGPAFTVAATSGSEQVAQVATAFVNALSALVTDSFGNPVSGVTVTFSVPASGATATLSATSAITNASGVASVTATAGTASGAYAATASATGASSAGFALTNTPGPPDEILINSGDGQSVAVGTAFAALQVTVVDVHDNPVPGAQVTFEPPASGASAIISPVSGMTNASGQISVAATANTKAGQYTVVVTATDANPTSFTLQNLPGSAATIVLTGGSMQSAKVGVAFAENLIATVKDASGNPVPGITVTFAVPASGASASLEASAVTDMNGTVSTPVLANATAGTYAVTATATGVSSPATFTLTNTAGAPDSTTATSGTPQSATIGTAFALPLTVTVLDGSNNPVAGATVNFGAPASGASATLSAPTAVTNASGQARITVTANNTAGTYSVSAMVPGGIAAATFELTNNVGAPASIVVDEGSIQTIPVGDAFLAALVAQVLDAGGNPVPGVTVNFAAPGSGASAALSASSSVSDANGLVRVVVIANGTPGTYSITATASGVATPAAFSLTNVVGKAQNIAVVSGTPQSATVGTAFAPLVVSVTDFLGNPVPGVTVNFAAPSSGASASIGATATTATNGQATITPTANTVAGAYTVTASAAGTAGPVSFALTNNAGPPAAIAITDGIDQSATVTSAYAIALTVRVTDASGNPVPGATVNYAAPASGATATLSSATAITDTTGQAMITATANGTAGTFSVSAAVTGAPPVGFILTNTVSGPGSITATSGTPQTAPILTDFAATLTVHVVDSKGNNVPNAVVMFAAPATGPSAVLSANSVETNSLGVASVAATANIVLGGPYTVTATVAGLTPATFSLTNSVGVGVNIAIVSGTPQTTGVLAALAQPLVVKVTDAGGNAVHNAPVEFIVPPSGASATVSATTLTTDATGQASVTVTANSILGSYVVLATAGQDISVSFGLTNGVGPAQKIAVVSGTPQTVPAGTAFAPLVVLVTDAAGNPVPLAIVSFAAPSSGASAVVTATVATNSSGQAAITPIANGVVGSYLVTASVTGVANSVAFSLTNTPSAPSALVIVSGSPQSTTVSTAFASPLVIGLADAAGNPIPGATISFTVPGSGASAILSAVTAVTDAGGVASVTATANSTDGTYVVTAALAGGGVAPRSFNLTNLPGPPASVKVVSGSAQTAVAGTAFGAAIQIVVTDASGNPIPGVVVTFSAPATGASAVLSAFTATTNASGVASITVTANNTVGGPYPVSATVAGLAPAVFELTNKAGTPGWISVSSGTPQTAAISTPFAAPLQVRVFDMSGNPVPGAAVNFASPPSGASATLSASMVTTDQSGMASVTAIANSTAGPFAVTASTAGVAGAVSFALTNTVGAVTTLIVASGSGQNAWVGGSFPSPFVVKLLDSGGNPVPGVAVTFVVPATGPSAILSSASLTTGSVGTAARSARRSALQRRISVATDSTGSASVTAMANGVTGSYVLTAIEPGAAAPVTFDLTNAAGPAAILFDQSGSPQAAAINSPFGAPLVVAVTDLGGNPVSGVSVSFSAPSSGAGASLSSPSAVTDAMGHASVNATAYGTAGTYQVIASIAGVVSNAEFSLTNTTGTPASLRLIGGTPQTATVLTSFAAPLTVKLVDANGNALSGVTIAFEAPATGSAAVLSRPFAVTDSSGQASVTATANGFPGSYVVYADAGGEAEPVSFSLTNTTGSPASVSVVSGSPQQAAPGSAFESPLTVRVADGAGNALPGVAVTFSDPSTGASANLSTTTVTTDSSGTAAVDAIASSSVGSYQVLATIAGVSTPAVFQLTNVGGQTLVSSVPSITLTGMAGISQLVSAPVTISTTGTALSFTATSSAPWLSVNLSNATAPATITVTANAAGLGSGTYTGNIVLITPDGAIMTVPVTLALSAPPRLATSPAGLSFVMTAGGAAPAPQQLSVASIDGFLPFTAATAVSGTGPNWLTLSTLSATSSSTAFWVSVSPGSYPPGSYQGTISILPGTAGIAPLTIPVSLTILPSAASSGSIQSVTNAASFTGDVAPGSLATIFGSSLSSGIANAMNVPLPFTLGGVTVTVDGKQAALLYVSPTQINLQIPVDVTLGNVQIVVTNNGTAMAPFPLFISASAPGIFIQPGTDQAAAQNPSYTINSPSQPVPAGQYLMLYLTGTGLTTPPVATGQPGPSNPFSLTGPIDVSIGGVPAQVLYSGLAPTLVGGIQINIVIPPGLSPGEYDVIVASGNEESNVATVSVGPAGP